MIFRLLLAILLLCSPAALAQTAAPNIYDKVPDEYLQEADQFHRQCLADAAMNLYYNCECMAVKYLDRRIEGGPDLTPSSISLSLQGECRDASQAAGAAYQRCTEAVSLLPEGMDPVQYCSCVANSFARYFENSTLAANSKNFTHLQAKAEVTCQDPKLGRRLYPDAGAAR
jgi:hypothetical protein